MNSSDDKHPKANFSKDKIWEIGLQFLNQENIRKNLPPVDPNSSFGEEHLVFSLGLDSLAMDLLCLELERQLAVEIPEEDRRSGYFASLEGIYEYLNLNMKFEN